MWWTVPFLFSRLSKPSEVIVNTNASLLPRNLKDFRETIQPILHQYTVRDRWIVTSMRFTEKTCSVGKRIRHLDKLAQNKLESFIALALDYFGVPRVVCGGPFLLTSGSKQAKCGCSGCCTGGKSLVTPREKSFSFLLHINPKHQG